MCDCNKSSVYSGGASAGGCPCANNRSCTPIKRTNGQLKQWSVLHSATGAFSAVTLPLPTITGVNFAEMTLVDVSGNTTVNIAALSVSNSVLAATLVSNGVIYYPSAVTNTSLTFTAVPTNVGNAYLYVSYF